MSYHYSGPDISSPHGDARLRLKPDSAALGPKAVGLWAPTLDWRGASRCRACGVRRPATEPRRMRRLAAMTLFVDPLESEAAPR
jgi:hypothetical protein